MDQTNQGANREWTQRTLDLTQQHNTEWQLCFAVEDESWHSLQQRHYQQRSDLGVGPTALREGKQLIQQQLRDIQDWRSIMASYRQKLAAQQAEESLNLEAEKRALSRYFLV